MQTTYEQRIYNQIIPKVGDVPLNQVTTVTIEKLYAHPKSDGKLVRREQYGTELKNSVIRSIHAIAEPHLKRRRRRTSYGKILPHIALSHRRKAPQSRC